MWSRSTLIHTVTLSHTHTHGVVQFLNLRTSKAKRSLSYSLCQPLLLVLKHIHTRTHAYTYQFSYFVTWTRHKSYFSFLQKQVLWLISGKVKCLQQEYQEHCIYTQTHTHQKCTEPQHFIQHLPLNDMHGSCLTPASTIPAGHFSTLDRDRAKHAARTWEQCIFLYWMQDTVVLCVFCGRLAFLYLLWCWLSGPNVHTYVHKCQWTL